LLPARLTIFVGLLTVVLPTRATAAEFAQPSVALPASQESPPENMSGGWKAASFIGGAASAFLLHESGHLVANLAFGNTPHLESVSFLGFVPFFAISPGISCFDGRCTREDGRPFAAGTRGLYVILSAGLQEQHIADEIILTHEPSLRFVEAPFRKGMLAFNTLTSIGYVLANWAGIEPSSGDLAGLYRNTATPRAFMNTMVLSIAVLDLARYYFPQVSLLPWVSRVCKIAVGGLVFTL
jgi:hypothetical protein